MRFLIKRFQRFPQAILLLNANKKQLIMLALLGILVLFGCVAKMALQGAD